MSNKILSKTCSLCPANMKASMRIPSGPGALRCTLCTILIINKYSSVHLLVIHVPVVGNFDKYYSVISTIILLLYILVHWCWCSYRVRLEWITPEWWRNTSRACRHTLSELRSLWWVCIFILILYIIIDSSTWSFIPCFRTDSVGVSSWERLYSTGQSMMMMMMGFDSDSHKQWPWQPQPWQPQPWRLMTNLVKFIQRC